MSPDLLMGDQRGKRQASNLTDTTLYVTVQGLEERNVFTLSTTFGNTCKCGQYVQLLVLFMSTHTMGCIVQLHGLSRFTKLTMLFDWSQQGTIGTCTFTVQLNLTEDMACLGCIVYC